MSQNSNALATQTSMETLENSRHRQEQRPRGQVKRDCKRYDRMDRRTRTP